MAKLFVAFVFAIFALNCNHIIEVVPEENDGSKSTTSDYTPSDVSPVTSALSTWESYPDYIASSSYEPLILIMRKDKIDEVFPIHRANYILLPNIQILSEKQLTDKFSPEEVIIYFCPQATWLERLGREYKSHRKNALFQKNFGHNEAHKCSIEPQYVVTNSSQETEATNCIKRLGLELHSVEAIIGLLLIGKTNPQTKKVVYKRYMEGMDELLRNAESGEIKNEDITVVSRALELYDICYDPQRQRASWIIRRITPWVQVERDLKKQEELYNPQEDNNNSKTIFHKIVPSEEYSFKLWERASDEANNYVLVSLKLKPLIDLIDERLEKYSRKVSRSIKVMTKLVYHENVATHQKPKLRGNHTYYRPELIILQAYDRLVDSAITIVIHNTLENSPQGTPLCKKTEKCDFMQWIEVSSIFEKYMNDELTKFAYCCTSIILYKFLTNTEKVMQINRMYEPLILKIKENQTDALFTIPSSEHDVIPFSSIQILSEKQSTNEPSQDKKKIYFCPNRTWQNKLKVKKTLGYTQFALLESRFNKSEAHRCSIQPWYISSNPSEEYQPKNCLSTQGMNFQKVGMQIAYPLIEEETQQTKEKTYKNYIEGIDELIKNVDSGIIQNEVITVASRMIEMYQLCYDNQTKRTHWIIREITPWAQVERDLKKQEELYSQEHNNDSGTTLHKIIPSEENSFKIWEHATSQEHNQVLVLLKLKPLLDLIDKHLEKYSRQVSRSIRVMTKLLYQGNVNEEEEAIQKENQNQRKPELLLIQAYDELEKSAITFVIHNSLEKPPEGRSYCKETAECNFMKWFEKSSIFEKYINDSVTKYAYCCKTLKDEFPMLLNTEIEEVMEINTIYEPVILMAKENQIDTLFPIESSEHNAIPFSSMQILSEKQLTDQLSPNKVKMYFCPYRTWLNKLKFEDTQHMGQFTLFQKRRSEDNEYRCSIEPRHISSNPSEEYQPTNCLSTQGLIFQEVGMQIAYPLIEEKTQETKEKVYKRYIEGIDELIKNIDSGKIQIEVIEVASRIIEMYQLCYDNQTKETNWIIREITPWALVERDLKKQEKLYTQEHNNNLGTTLHKIVPSEENSFKIWQHATSYEYNQVLVSLKLKPLIDLIDQHLEKYSMRVCETNTDLVGKYCTKLKLEDIKVS